MSTRGLVAVLVIACVASPAAAQNQVPTPIPTRPPRIPIRPKPEPPIIEGDPLAIGAKNRKVMLMTFLERAREELERASLEKRSFIPEIVKTVDGETL
ncbi:MAG: hypothetical protein AB7T06_46400 [Kofleriaceae bacterium]